MKLSSGKLQFLEGKSPLLVPEHFFPRPYWFFTFHHVGHFFRAWRNVRGWLNISYFVHFCTPKDVSSNLPAQTLSFFQRVNLRKIIEMSSGMEKSSIPAWVRDKMFPSPDHLVRRHPVRVAESCVRSCYRVELFWLSRFRRVMKFHEGSLDALVYLPQEKLGNPVTNT
jgi:hypothetical protein